MDMYKANLTGLLALCVALYAAPQWRGIGAKRPTPTDGYSKTNKGCQTKTDSSETVPQPTKASAATVDASGFLVVYTLVMAADWLQGPFLYSLYTEEHRVPVGRVPLLFATGFVAGGVSASVVGGAADRYGRKRACLIFCAAYAACCVLTVAAPMLPLLLAGRVLGGISTSLLFSVFESWMVTDFWEREKFESAGEAAAAGEQRKGDGNASAIDRTKEMNETAAARLSHTFGRMGTLNSLAAIASGVFSEWVVSATGTRKAPFMASAVLLGVAAWQIATRWNENYGEAATKDKEDGGGRVLAVLRDPPVLILGLASTLFEGSMYLFVFFWSPALQEAAAGPLPYGIIFASFMAAAMAATFAFNAVTAQLRLVRCVTLLLGLLCAAEAVFYLLSSTTQLAEQSVFWLFCLFEACVGTYWPSMGYLKGQLVPDGARAQVYALLRVPLNVFVVAALLLTRDGEYAAVFSGCSTLLLVAIAGVVAMMVNEPHLP